MSIKVNNNIGKDLTPSIFTHTNDLVCSCGKIHEVPEDALLQEGSIFCELCQERFKVSESLAREFNKQCGLGL